MSLFSNSKLQAAWSTRSWEIEAQRLQDANDLLYDYLRYQFVACRRTLQDELIEVIKSAKSLKDLQIPLWSYHTTFLPKLPREDYEKVQSHIRRHGYEWSIGLVDKYFDAETSVYYEWNWLWKTRPVTIHNLVNKTDLLRRLALLFGTDFRIVARSVAIKTLEEFGGVKVYKTELQLQYYPNGLPRHYLDEVLYTQEKYADYKAPVREALVHLWTGVPSVVQSLPPSRSSTPPPSAPAEVPPVLPKRSNGGGIERDLSGPRILTYEGPDALERAARDLITDTRACHCNDCLFGDD
jgi:hypothetical protein